MNLVFEISSFLVTTRIRALIKRFLFSNLEQDLLLAKNAIEKLWLREKRQDFAQRVIVISGWISKSNNGRISKHYLETINPGYTVKVSRRVRRDLLAHRKEYGIYSAFKVQVSRESDVGKYSPAFRFLLSDGNENIELLTPSNPQAKSRIAALLEKPPGSARKAIGFIDDVRVKASSELEAVVTDATDELIQFARSELGQFVCAKASSILKYHGRKEEAEKFAFLDRSPNENYKIFQKVFVQRYFIPERHSGSNLGRRIALENQGDGVMRSRPTKGSLSAPGEGWLALRRVELLGGSLVLNQGILECYEYAADPAWDFVSGLWQIQFGSRRIKDEALVKRTKGRRTELNEVILIGGRNDSNYYHFLIEYLPRILNIPKSIGKTVPVVISNSVPRSGLEALQKLTKREIIQIDPKRVYMIKKLHVSAPVAQVLDTTMVPWADGVFVNFESLDAFRQECLSLINPSSTPSRRIFLKRDSGHRNLINGEKLETIAKELGYEVIDVAGMGWEEQVGLFSSAEIVVGAGGAVMANYIFLPKNAKVLSLTSEYLADFVLPAYMTAVSGASFTYLTGRAKVTKFSRSNTQHMMHSGFTIKESSFKNALINLSR